MEITTKKVKLSAIRLSPDNPRTISKKDMDLLVKSLADFPEMMELRPCLIGFRSLTKNVSGIYAIFNSIDDRLYIGSAVSITNRIGIHKNDLRRNRHHSQHLQNFYNKYGKECLAFALLCEIENPTKASLIKTEQSFLDILRPAFNCNTKADSRMGCVNSPETRKRISESRLALDIRYDDDYKRRMSIALSGENNPMYGKSPNWGKKHKPETIKKMIESHHDVKGVNNPKYGIPQSKEATAKARITHSNRVFISGRGVNAFRDGNLIGTYLSAMEASRATGICFSSIYRVCNGNWRQSHGLQFAFTGGQDGISQAIGA